MRIEATAVPAGCGGPGAAFGEALSRARGADARGRAPPPRGDRVPGEEAAGAAHAGPAPREPAPQPAAPAELAAVARALPPAIAAGATARGAPLALSFGPSLDVELRSTEAGVHVVLRPAPRLALAAEGELPRLVAALRIRGVAVARAEVRPRSGRGRAR
jgi:hypothetical protein